RAVRRRRSRRPRTRLSRPRSSDPCSTPSASLASLRRAFAPTTEGPVSSAAFWKADPKAGMQEMLEPAMLIGLGAVAVWTYLNYPRLRPRSLLRAVMHVA